jgi:hypothetical protein
MAITLNTKVYTFRGFLQGLIAKYSDNTAGVPAGFNVLTATVNDPAKNSPYYKVRWKLKLPTIVASPDCACPDGVSHDSFVDIVVSVSSKSTAAERDNLSKQIKDLTASPEFLASVNSLLVPSA